MRREFLKLVVAVCSSCNLGFGIWDQSIRWNFKVLDPFFYQIEKLPLLKINNRMSSQKLDGKFRKNIQIGVSVEIVQKHHQRSGELTEGSVKRLLTKSASHPHGIKVQLESGEVGRVKYVLL